MPATAPCIAVQAPPESPAGALPAGLPAGSVWRASHLAQSGGETCSTGFEALDAELPGGGWPLGALIELLLERPGIGELSMLLPVLARTRPEQWTVWLAPPLLPYAPALETAGVPLSRLLIVRPGQPRTLLWAARQAAVSGSCAAVLAWLPKIDNGGLRRLQLAAEAHATPLFLFRPLEAAGQASPAPLRLALAAREGQLEVKIVKRRGPPAGRPLLLHIGPAAVDADVQARQRPPCARAATAPCAPVQRTA